MAALTTTALAVGATAYSADRQSDAAKEASRTQERAGNKAIESNNRALDIAREDVQPFRDTGGQALNPLLAATRDASSLNQADQFSQQGNQLLGTSLGRLNSKLNGDSSVTDNPLFQGLLAESTRGITANQAASGKLGSGDTLNDLANASLSIGAELDQRDTNNLITASGLSTGLINNGESIRNNRTNQLFNLASLGSNAATGQATNTLNTAAQNSNLTTQIGNANAAGKVGKANALTNGVTNLVGITANALNRKTIN